jgi:hypothetical protein
VLSKEREDGSKEDETIVNHFHGVSSSSEFHRDVCGQTDQGSSHNRNSGQYTDTFKCNIEVTGKVCGSERNLIHCKDKTVSTNVIGLSVSRMMYSTSLR